MKKGKEKWKTIKSIFKISQYNKYIETRNSNKIKA